MLLSYLW